MYTDYEINDFLGYSTRLLGLFDGIAFPWRILLPRCVHCFYAVLVDVGYVRHGHTFRAGWLPPKSDAPGVNLPERSLGHFMSILGIPDMIDMDRQYSKSPRNKTGTHASFFVE